MQSSEPSSLSGPIPLPTIELPTFITGGSMGNKMEEGKLKLKSKGVESGLEGGLEDLFKQFTKLTPSTENAVVFFKKLLGNLASLGEGEGSGTSLQRGSFLWSAWRYHGHRCLVSHLSCFAVCFLYHALYAFITLVMVHKQKGDTHNTIGIAMMAGFMLMSLSY